jgi:hypothetical protein
VPKKLEHIFGRIEKLAAETKERVALYHKTQKYKDALSAESRWRLLSHEVQKLGGYITGCKDEAPL